MLAVHTTSCTARNVFGWRACNRRRRRRRHQCVHRAQRLGAERLRAARCSGSARRVTSAVAAAHWRCFKAAVLSTRLSQRQQAPRARRQARRRSAVRCASSGSAVRTRQGGRRQRFARGAPEWRRVATHLSNLPPAAAGRSAAALATPSERGNSGCAADTPA